MVNTDNPPPLHILPTAESVGGGGGLPSEKGTSTPAIHPPSEGTPADWVGWLLAEFNVRSLEPSQREAFITRAVAAGIQSEDVTVLHWWFSEFEKKYGPSQTGGYVAKAMESSESWRAVLAGARTAFARANVTKPYPNQVYQDTTPVEQAKIDYVIERVCTDGKPVAFVAEQMGWPVSKVEELVGGQT